MKIGHLVILNTVQDIEDIQGQEQWKEIVHTILRIGKIRALNESAGRLFRAATQHRQNNSDNQSKYGCKDQESIQSSTTPDPGYQWESDKLTVDTTNESQKVSPFPAGDHKAHLNRRAQRHSKHKTEQKQKRSTKEVPPWNGQ